MYNLEQKLKMEAEKNPRVILLFLEGGFYRAYEQSAFLAVKCLQNFKVTTRYFKSVGNHVAMIGFPVASLAKFATGNSVEQREDMALLTLPEVQTLPDEATYKAWKDALPVTNENSNAGPRPAGKGIQNILQRISSFPLENRTPLQCMIFLAEIKSILSGDNK